MYKSILLACLVLIVGMPLLGQEPLPRVLKEERAQIKEAQQAFLIEQLSLTEAEADAFFPIFWEYEKRIRQQRRYSFSQGRRVAELKLDLTEAEALKKLLDLRRERQAVLTLQLEAEEKYLEVLPATKVVRLEAAEKAFRERLWKRVRERWGKRRGGG